MNKRIIVTAVLAVLVVQAAVAITLYFALTSWTERGQFGDQFGFVNAMFSGLAFAALIYTVHLQRDELSLQRQELELTRGELRRSALAQEASEKALREQAAANTTSTRLAVITTLLGHFQAQFEILRARGSGISAPELEQKMAMFQKTQVLLDMLESEYSTLEHRP